MKNNNYLWTHTGSKLSNPMPTVIFCQWISHVWMVQIPVWMIEIWILTARRYHERLRVFDLFHTNFDCCRYTIVDQCTRSICHCKRERPTSKVTLSTRMGIRWFVILFTIIWSGLVLDPNLSHLAIESLLNEEKSEIRAKKIAALIWSLCGSVSGLGWKLCNVWPWLKIGLLLKCHMHAKFFNIFVESHLWFCLVCYLSSAVTWPVADVVSGVTVQGDTGRAGINIIFLFKGTLTKK